MSIKRFNFCIFFLITTIAFSQNETVNWYFGYQAGLNFSANNNTPTLLTDSAMITPAGCSSISDSQGNLLFYTNGNTVWNKDHQIMESGEKDECNS